MKRDSYKLFWVVMIGVMSLVMAGLIALLVIEGQSMDWTGIAWFYGIMVFALALFLAPRWFGLKFHSWVPDPERPHNPFARICKHCGSRQNVFESVFAHRAGHWGYVSPRPHTPKACWHAATEEMMERF